VQIDTDSKGTWIVTWSGISSDGDSAIFCVVSTDNGITWSLPKKLSSNPVFGNTFNLGVFILKCHL
jgi:hypothetical protein